MGKHIPSDEFFPMAQHFHACGSKAVIDSAEGSEKISKKEIRLVICFIEGIPSHGQFVPHHPLADQRRLSGTRDAGNDDQRRMPPLSEPIEKMRPLHHSRFEGGHAQLRVYETVCEGHGARIVNHFLPYGKTILRRAARSAAGRFPYPRAKASLPLTENIRLVREHRAITRVMGTAVPLSR